EQLRTYYRSLRRHNGWMFPSGQAKRPQGPITDKTVWHACEESTRRAAITKPMHPHTLRHCLATHMLDNGAELPVTQVLLGHDDPRDTMIYLHLSKRKLKSAPSPLEMFDLAGKTEPGAGGLMNRPALEVADIFRAFAHRFIERSRARISWPQHKVMRA